MASIKDIGRFFLFIIGGLVAIIVGSYMIRGTMHMWDKPEDETKRKSKDQSSQSMKNGKNDNSSS